jgi:anti-sigma factor RsiW
MSKDYTKLSAYIDGELTPEEVIEIQSLLGSDSDFANELKFLEAADLAANSDFDEMLNEPISPNLIAQIQATELGPSVPVAANSNFKWRSIAAAALFMLVGGVGGYVINEQTAPDVQIAASKNWLEYVAGYHGIYAGQKRHLVEVAANESEHIKNWLSKTTNVGFSIPDLSQHGLEFRGARLLVVKSQPVAQLMFTDKNGAVVAICFKQGANGGMGSEVFEENQIDDFDIISWNERSANFLVIGDAEQNQLKNIADTVRLNI